MQREKGVGLGWVVFYVRSTRTFCIFSHFKAYFNKQLPHQMEHPFGL